MEPRKIALAVGAAVPLGLIVALLASKDDDQPAPAGGSDSWEAIKAARAALPPIPGKVVKQGPGIMYMGADDKDHVAYLREKLEMLASSDAARARGIRAFRALQGREGSTSSLNTYDNQIVTWGTGFGGLGLMPQVFERLAGTQAAKVMARAGLRYAGNREYEVVDGAGKTVRGKGTALNVIRATPQLLQLLVHVARDPATRDDVTKAQLETFLAFSGKITGHEQAATQALINFIAHLQHWAPGYGNGALAWAATQVPGPPSAQRDVELAARALEFFYDKARAKPGAWIPSWTQAKHYWQQMVQDGLGPAANHPLLAQAEPPSAVKVAGTWGVDARGQSVFKLVSALSDAHGQSLKALGATAKEADAKRAAEGKDDRANADALGKLLAWSRHKFGPEGLREEQDRHVPWLVFLAPPWFGLDMQGWSRWQQELQNLIDRFAGSTVSQYTEATFNEAEGFRRAHNAFAAKFRERGIDVPDVAQAELAPIAPTAADVEQGLKDAGATVKQGLKDAVQEVGGGVATVVVPAVLGLGALALLARRIRS